MNLINFFTYLFVFKNYKYQDKLGYDERFPLIESKILIPKIIKNHQQKELLNYLESTNINEIDKTKKIHEYYKNDIKPHNILSGGLMNDWNFDL